MIRYRLRRYTKDAFPRRFKTDDIIAEYEYLKDASDKSIELNTKLAEEQGYKRVKGQEPGWYVEEITAENTYRKDRVTRARPIS